MASQVRSKYPMSEKDLYQTGKEIKCHIRNNWSSHIVFQIPLYSNLLPFLTRYCSKVVVFNSKQIIFSLLLNIQIQTSTGIFL